MKSSLSLGTVVRRTFSAYTAQAPVLLASALALTGMVKLDNALFEHAAAVGAGLFNLLVLSLFVCFVVLAAAEAYDGGNRTVGELLRGASSAVGRLLLVGVVAGLALAFVSSLGSGILIALIIGAAFAAGANVATIIVGVLVLTIVLLVPELFLLTVWSVFVPVAVLERPRGLHALGRSRELVRGNGWRVLMLLFLFTLPISLISAAVAGAPHLLGHGLALAGGVLLATLITPIPVLAMTALYYELRSTERTSAPLGGPDPSPACPAPRLRPPSPGLP